ncbi:hypothetical protein [Actinoplanes sp. CA-252034]|uniref:hypothetical protein n=1 Tax=Actinoplanes sp. CA-252034 TaxID=3239906 RepID=UPI003D99D4F4
MDAVLFQLLTRTDQLGEEQHRLWLVPGWSTTHVQRRVAGGQTTTGRPFRLSACVSR